MSCIVTKNGDVISPGLMEELLVIQASTLLSFIGHCNSEKQANEKMAVVFPNMFLNVCGYMSLQEAQKIISRTKEQRYDDENGE